VSRARAGLAAALATAALVACGDSIVRGWLVDRTRVLGVRIEAASDASRAAIAPGEAGTMTWLVAAPDAVPPLSWSYAACAPPSGNFAEVRCDDRPALASGSGDANGELVAMPLAMPSADALGGSTQVLVLAAFCAGGAASLDAASFTGTCADGSAPLLASAFVPVANGADANHNPSPPSGLTMGGAPLPPDDATPSGATCDAAPAAPVIGAGQKPKLGYTFGDADREPGESLLLSLLTTAGELDHPYFALDPQEAAPKAIEDEWTAPSGADVGPNGRVVRFYAVLRDGRGGASFARFAVCVR
jgi:hypothetical protein